ncbi:hypothetical protein JXJ21_09085 [candidate division KSB1 bacterium]|nr:hypothetical protein [candidate division KSB1 bacterium]
MRTAYRKISKETEEFFAARIEGKTKGLFYKITREDGGFDTGLKPLSEKITEELPLVPDSYNFFKFSVFDEYNNLIPADIEPIEISHGITPPDAPLPHDLSLEVDDLENNSTELELIFKKNSSLPSKYRATKILNKSIMKGSKDSLIIHVLEGPGDALPEANKTIGYCNITGEKIVRDLLKGSEIEIDIEISESRIISGSVFITMTDQVFTIPFNFPLRNVPVDMLVNQLEELSEKIESEMEVATETENYETANELKKLKSEAESLLDESYELKHDDITDKRNQFEDKKRKLAQELGIATKDKKIQTAKKTYFETKEKCREQVMKNGNDSDRARFEEIVNQENAFLTSNSLIKLREKIDELEALYWGINLRTPEFLIGAFEWLISERQKFNDQRQAKSLIEAGRFAIQCENFDRLAEVNLGLVNLLPRTDQDEAKRRIGFYKS